MARPKHSIRSARDSMLVAGYFREAGIIINQNIVRSRIRSQNNDGVKYVLVIKFRKVVRRHTAWDLGTSPAKVVVTEPLPQKTSFDVVWRHAAQASAQIISEVAMALPGDGSAYNFEVTRVHYNGPYIRVAFVPV